MSEWREVTLTQLGKLSSGKSIKPGQKGPFRAFGSNGVIGQAAEPRHQHGVIVGRVGAYCGSVAISREPFWASDNTIVVEPLDGSDLDFLYYLLRSANLNQHAGGAAQPLITQRTLKSLSFRVPDPSGRFMISAVLRALDDLIENNRRRVEVLEEMARAIYREWFVHFRYPGHEDVPLVDSPLGPIPEGWGVGVLGDLVELERPNIQPSKSPDETFDHYSIPAFDDGQRPAIEAGDVIKSGKYLLSAPSILVSKLNPRIDRVWFAEPDKARRCVTSTEFLILRTTEQSNLDHLYLLARDPEFREQLKGLSGGTSGSHQRAKPGDFLNLPVVLPRSEVVDALAEATGSQLRLARHLRRHANYLASLRDLLLPKLVTGQVDVSHLDLDALVGVAGA